jgi:RNAse (barnase) inhibitor barstar
MFKTKNYTEVENFRSPRYREVVKRYCGIGENADLNYSAKGKKIKEQLVKCIWAGQFIKKERLHTEDGLRIKVISPGRWNTEEGPDFKGAEILLEGKGEVKGDIEIHVYSHDWIRHGHHKQKAYESICLHVFMWNDRKSKYVKIKNHFIPQLELYKYLELELEKLIEMIDIEDYPHPAGANAGPCQKGLCSIASDDKWIGYFLDFAGDERILVKTNRLEKCLNTQTFEQILYEAIMESLGYKNNKEQFRHLASIVSVNEIKSLIPLDASVTQRSKMIQALLFGMAGLLPDQQHSTEDIMDKYSIEYVREIDGMWSVIKNDIENKPMDGELWCFKYSRPGNFPTRRIAAISHLLSENFETGIFRKILESFEKVDGNKNEVKRIKKIIKNTESIFMELYDDYWSYYHIFEGKRLRGPERLIGNDRSSVIFINIIIPILLAYARKTDDLVLEERLFKVYKLHPKLSPNNVTRFMSCRIFGQDTQKRNIVNNARRQQGLIQIFKDFCESNDIACKRCVLLLSINSMPGG